jgi:hypothetical protein
MRGHGLVIGRARRRKRSDCVRWQRPAAMQLWQLDIVNGPRLVDPVTGELREGRIVTGVDDHSRYRVIAAPDPPLVGADEPLAEAHTRRCPRPDAPSASTSTEGRTLTIQLADGVVDGHGGNLLEVLALPLGRSDWWRIPTDANRSGCACRCQPRRRSSGRPARR